MAPKAKPSSRKPTKPTAPRPKAVTKPKRSPAKPSKPSKPSKPPRAARRTVTKARPNGRSSASSASGVAAKVAAPKPTAAPRSVPANPPSKEPAAPKQGTPSRDVPDGEYSVAGQIYKGGKLSEGVLHIDAATGRITKLAKSTTLARHYDYGNLAILPGALDIHVHFREPGHTHKEDITTGSVSAAFGGVTGFVDMPNTLPATISLRTVKEKLALMAQKSVVDYAVWAGGSWYTGDLPQMLRYAVGVKTYLGATTGDLLLEDQERLHQILAAAATAGRPVTLHAESQRVLQQMKRAEAGLTDHDTFRPPLAEVEAIYDTMKAATAAKKAPTIHIAHIASSEAVDAARGAKFSMGACPHHLLLDTTASLTHAYGKMNPPLRSPAARKALWAQFAAGRIPILESDHAPHTQVEKEDNFHAAPSGVPGVETMAPLMLAQTKAGTVDLSLVVDALTKNPAQLLGLSDRGVLDTGMRADFAVYDLKKTTKVDADHLHSKCGWTPFAGHNAIFPVHTVVGGRFVVQDGGLAASPGGAKPLKPLPKE